MIIRAAQDNDIAAITALQAKSWQDTYRGMLPDDFLDYRVADDMGRQWRDAEIGPNDLVLVAEDGEVVGFIAVWCRPDPYIDNLHVLPGLRSKGIGRKLMAAAAAELQARGHESAYLWVFPDNLGAIRFYERLGGRHGETVSKTFFGNETVNLRIFWDDLSVIVGAGYGDGQP